MASRTTRFTAAEQAEDSMAVRTVRVRFDPKRLKTDPISVEPELVELSRGGGTEIDFELEMPRGSDQRATFPASDFIRVDEDCELGMVYDSPRKVKLLVPFLNSSPRRGAYHLRIEYQGQIYQSEGYPGYEDRGPDT